MRITIASILLVLNVFAFAQHTLVLDKPGKRKRIHYKNGDMIHLKLYNGMRFSGRIWAIQEGSIFVEQDQVLIKDIKAILDPDKRSFHRSVAYKALTGAAVSVVFSMANNVFNEERGPVLGQDGTNVTLFFLTVGAIFLPMQNKKYRQGKWRFRCMDLRPG